MNDTLTSIKGDHPWPQFKRILLLVLLSFCCITLASSTRVRAEDASAEKLISLQQLIDRARPGDSILLAPGTYEGPVHIDKRLTLRGAGAATVVNNTPDSAITIRADGVTLQGLNIQQDADGEAGAIQVKARDVTLEQLAIHTGGFGIVLRNANGGTIRNNKIRWFVPKGAAPGTRGNAIDLYNSHGNQIRDNEISYLRDGIYLEDSRNTTVTGNKLSHLRYGIHCMYINGSTLTDNVGEYNVTGAMVMGVTDVTISGNSFRKQSQNVHSQGILLFDVHTSSIVNNTVEGNRVGIVMERSAENELRDNVVLRNFIGIQFVNAEGNRFRNNGFIANVIEAQATSSKNNLMNGNYWDSFQGLDVNRDGKSDMAYAINPFYQNLIGSNAAYQLFFQSPGMSFLSEMFTGGKENWSTDNEPLMTLRAAAAVQPAQKDGTVMVAGWVLLFLSVITIIYLGVLRL